MFSAVVWVVYLQLPAFTDCYLFQTRLRDLRNSLLVTAII